MSGIVGIVNLDGAPVDRDLLWRMTQFMAPRGPDAQEIWTDGSVGFGHTLLKTTFEAERERQPLTLDGQVWITADCRVDGREDLIRELTGHGRVAGADAPDPELVLHAYAVWGEECCKHLLGDFSFAIWDARRRVLFCARDHFGVKPFLYARVGKTVAFSNTLNCVRLHPAVSNRLDELTIADLLMFGIPQELDGTAFAEIRRLSPAHTLTVEAGDVRVKRYWDLPEEDELRYRRRGEYMEHFRELLDTATKDRLRFGKVGVMMSGGLDSPTIAATARRIMAGAGSPFDLRAHNVYYERLVPDEERKWSAIAAKGIGIPIHHYPLDDYGFPPEKPAAQWWHPPEPISLWNASAVDIHRPLVAKSPVLLTGYGSDPLIDLPSVEPMLRQGRYICLFRDYLWLMWVRRRFVRAGIRTLLRRNFSRQAAVPAFPPLPDWLQAALTQRFDLRSRWTAHYKPPDPAQPMPCELLNPFWPFFLEYCDPGVMGLAGDLRHPFLDLRLVRYLRRLPPFPWFIEKSLLRVSMKGMLPEAILRRPKVPIAGNPSALMLPPARTRWWEPYLSPGNGLEGFIDVGVVKVALGKALAAVQPVNNHGDIDRLGLGLRPVGLGLWLKGGFGTNSTKTMKA